MRKDSHLYRHNVATPLPGLSPSASHFAHVLELYANANARLRLDDDTVALISSQQGISTAEGWSIVDQLEAFGVLAYLGLDLRGGAS